MPGVSLQIDKYKGTITNAKGVFTIKANAELIAKNGITFSYSGYKKLRWKYVADMPGTIQIEPAENNLEEVTVSGKGKTIIKNAIAAIPQNFSLSHIKTPAFSMEAPFPFESSPPKKRRGLVLAVMIR